MKLITNAKSAGYLLLNQHWVKKTPLPLFFFCKFLWTFQFSFCMFHLTLIIFFGLKLSRGQPKLICFHMRRCLTSALIHLTKGPFVWRYHHVTTSIMNITTFCNINNRYKERMMKLVKNFILQANGRRVRDVRTLWKFDSSKRFSFLHKFHNYFNTRVILKLAV